MIHQHKGKFTKKVIATTVASPHIELLDSSPGVFDTMKKKHMYNKTVIKNDIKTFTILTPYLVFIKSILLSAFFKE
jgi:hypothetical protein